MKNTCDGVQYFSMEMNQKICIKNVFTLKNDISSEITNIQEGLLFKEHSWRRRFSILFSILSIIVSVINYSYIWNKIWETVWQHFGENVF